MRKHLIKAMSILLIISSNLIAQPYGEITYPFAANTILNSAIHARAGSNEGFVMAGVQVTSALGQPNFFISRTSSGGELVGATFEFQNEYLTYVNASCGTTPAQLLDLAGLSVIQTTNSSSANEYAVCGANSMGVFFALLDITGTPLLTSFYQYPGGSNTANYKPHIIESNVTPGTFFIVGSYAGGTIGYALHINGAGGIINQLVFNATPAVWITDILESPYTGNPIVAVGSIDFPAPGTQEAIFFGFNQALTGIVVNYGYDLNGANDYLSSIEVANCPTGGAGFIVGGHTPGSNIVQGQSLVMKIQTSGVPIWSSVIEGITDPTIGKVKQVLERQNTIGNWEYYALSDISQGMVVYKLDDAGNPFGQTYPGNADEFVYSSFPAQPLDMTLNDDASRPDVGLHIYAYNFPNSGNFQFIESYFNGLSGCSSTANITNVDPTPLFAPALGWTATTGLISCSNFFLTQSPTSQYAPTCGPFPSVPGGSNAKINGVKENSMLHGGLKVYQQNQRQVLQFSFKTEPYERDLKIYDINGQMVLQQIVSANSTVLTISSSNLSPGIYIANFNSEGSDAQVKFLISNEK